jgi:recombination protein RecA
MNPQLAALRSRFASARDLSDRNEQLRMATGIPELDLPRGAISEVVGAAASGRTTLLCSTLAAATQRQEACAVVDTADTFDPASAAAAGVDLRFLLWVRCAAKKRCALQVVDWLLQAGGFGVVALDLANLTENDVRNIPLHTWFRFRRAVEHKPTVLLVISSVHCTSSTAALQLEMSQRSALWRNAAAQRECAQGSLFHGAALEAIPRKPVAQAWRPAASFEAETCLLA